MGFDTSLHVDGKCEAKLYGYIFKESSIRTRVILYLQALIL